MRAAIAFVRNFFRGFSFLVLCVLLVPATVFVVILGAFIFLPLPATLPEPNAIASSQGSKIYDADGNELYTFRRFDQNVPIEEKDIPLILKQALISSEDRNFYNHSGVDVRGSTRALWSDIRNQGAVQGGSTITQQYVKNAYLDQDRTLQRKVREAILASQLDRQMDKDEILFNYLSTTYFGNGAYGIGAAAQTYFRKPVAELNASESAVLVGLIPAPSAWDPRNNPVDSEARRKSVLSQMQGEGYLNQQQYDEAVAQVEWLVDTKGEPNVPATKIYGVEETTSRYPYFVDYVGKYLTAKYGEQALYTGGLRVQTTLKPEIQDEAEATVAQTLNGTGDPLSMALVSVEPQTGYVRALVGGRDFNSSQLNLALGGCPSNPFPSAATPYEVQAKPTCWDTPVAGSGGTGRQPGSSFKPFVMAAAYEEGKQPSEIYSAPTVYRAPGCKIAACLIYNDETESFGPTSIKESMAHSINTVYAPLSLDVGLVQTAQMASKLGVTSAIYSRDFHQANGNYSLGVIDVSPLDMAAAYSVFANSGVRQVATPVVKVQDLAGNVLEDNTSREGEQVIDKAVADNVTDALEGVIDHGTAARTANIGRPAAGKTGTTNDFGDAWFVGYTPTLSTSVWMGYSDGVRRINYKGNRSVYGGSVPASTWANFMRDALKDVPETNFEQPTPIRAPEADVLNEDTVVSSFSPNRQRTPITTPAGTYDRTSNTPPSISAPSTTSTTVPGAGPNPAG